MLTKVLYDAIDRFSRMEMAVGCEMVPVAVPARSALCGTWAREAGELLVVVGQSTLGWEGGHDQELGVVKLLEHWKVKSRDFEPEEGDRSLETS